MKTQSLWNAYCSATNFPSLKENISADVTIIGGGITGITTAQLLSEAGLKVVVLEARKIAGGTTSHSTGNLYIFDKYTTDIHKKFGITAVKTLLKARTDALNLITTNINKYGIDCDYYPTSWNVYSSSTEANSKVEQQLRIAKELSLNVSQELPQVPYHVKKSISLEGQAQFNPASYTKGLAKACSSQCSIYEDSQVVEISEHDSIEVKTEYGKVTSKYLVHATHIPKGIMTVQTLLGPYREYGIACTIEGSHPRGIFWGYYTSNDLISTRTYERDGKDYIVIVGHPHKVGQSENNIKEIKKLETFAHEHFKVKEVTHRWGGQHYRPADHLPYIGRRTHNSKIFYATGFATDGLNYGTVAAAIIRDELKNVKNEAANLLSPSRFNPIKSAPSFIKENINVLKQYILDLPGKVDAEEFTDISIGEGRVIEKDGQKLAVHRSDDQNLHICSAVCSHMQCIVDWNTAEKSWDCPCHGSRFDTEGKVLEGPAVNGLDTVILEGGHIKTRHQA
jgi:glycine/D-amino acid oxidase-like deaminating enzyme/nitrite reductase/ring-hydroxylating ferredoxin subunit